MAIEMHERGRWILHRSVRHAVDAYFKRQYVTAEELTPGQSKEVVARGVRTELHCHCRMCV